MRIGWGFMIDGLRVLHHGRARSFVGTVSTGRHQLETGPSVRPKSYEWQARVAGQMSIVIERRFCKADRRLITPTSRVLF